MQWTAKQIADVVSGRIVGDQDVVILRPGKIEEAEEGEITFLANPKYEEHIYTTKASAVLVGEDFTPRHSVEPTLIHVEDVYQTLAFLLEKFGGMVQQEAAISELAFIEEGAELAEGVSVGPFAIVKKGARIGKGSVIHGQAYIGSDVQVGEQCVIYPGVKIYHECELGNHCILHSNAVVGSDGFGFQKDDQGRYQKVPQIGRVVLRDHVEIGANTVVDRATMGKTLIGQGTKLDNLIQIAHNVEIGENTVIAAQTGIAGSTKIGDDALIGGQVGIVGHIHIADKTMIQAGSGINKNVTQEGAKLYGYPALPYTQYLRSYAVFKDLPDLRKRINELEKKLDELQNKA